MRSRFQWYFQPTDEQIRDIWKSAILTVDTNVLLDMYRYHESTRNSLLQGIKIFAGRAWLSHQSATEFFRNRKSVIISSSVGFQQATTDITELREELSKTISKLRSNRIIPSSTIDNFENTASKHFEELREEISNAELEFPKFLNTDPILDELLEIFENSVGNECKPADFSNLKTEGERRQKEKIPPGFLDANKKGLGPLGDYFMWQQILDHAKTAQRPVILVTSERKDDWWERHSGRTVGPRQELLKEAADVAGQPILIYQTERFLEFVSSYTGSAPLNPAVAEEIREVGETRTKSPAVLHLTQSTKSGSFVENSGVLHIELLRPVRHFTVTGHFSPPLLCAPNLQVTLTQSPTPIPACKVRANTGTTYDFNIHVNSQSSEAFTPGIYSFEYTADISDNLLNLSDYGSNINSNISPSDAATMLTNLELALPIQTK